VKTHLCFCYQLNLPVPQATATFDQILAGNCQFFRPFADLAPLGGG
jgi:hypothetical protein